MQRTLRRNAWIAAFVAGLLLCASGCRHRGDTFNMAKREAAWNASKQRARQELTEIPPPAKKASFYSAIRYESQWQNPFISVETGTLQLRIYLPDENPSQIDRGGLTRLSAARKHTLTIRLGDLPRALTSLPDNAWPYGRIIAVNEALEAPEYQAKLRRNLAITEQALQDMGIQVQDWSNRRAGP